MNVISTDFQKEMHINIDGIPVLQFIGERMIKCTLTESLGEMSGGGCSIIQVMPNL